MKNKILGRIILPTVIAVKAIVIFLVLSSVKNDDPENVNPIETKITYNTVKIPEKVEFAGEQIPLEKFYIKESLDRELLVNAYLHSQTIRLIKLAPRYFSVIEPILQEKGVPDDFKYLAVAESGLNPRAVSPANAVGLWQFLKTTAQQYGLTANNEIDERYNIKKSTYAACDYLLNSYKRYGSWSMVAASYNAGLTGVNRQIEMQKINSYYDLLFSEETSRYVYRIIALKLILENPVSYNFYVPDEEKYPIINTREIEITSSVTNFATFAAEQGVNYKLLKDFNPWLRQNYLNVIPGKKYIVEIPLLQ
ncbi:MAG: lytic transglycosylase domain-containing protein [Bacteroidales bacterium]|jgi:hypothetical protein|nr:lytic transglycosylase domain-containing protein [Bacteroidales bacterium]